MEGLEDVHGIISDYFKTLFKSEFGGIYDHVLSQIQPCISPTSNVDLE